MFTGLIQGLGQVIPLSPYQIAVQCLGLAPPAFLAAIELGDSIAVDGVCLTVEAIRDRGFVASVSPETLKRTTLGQGSGRWVNLEPSLRVGDKIGGHFVSGHVDGLGHLVSVQESATSWSLTFASPPSLWPHLVPKGSIAVNGISLTIAHCNQDPGDSQGQFTVAVIPLSYAQTNLHQLSPGDGVNLEGDILSKYVGQLLRAPNVNSITKTEGRPLTLWDMESPESLSPQASHRSKPAADGDLSLDFLSENGYL